MSSGMQTRSKPSVSPIEPFPVDKPMWELHTKDSSQKVNTEIPFENSFKELDTRRYIPEPPDMISGIRAEANGMYGNPKDVYPSSNGTKKGGRKSRRKNRKKKRRTRRYRKKRSNRRR